MTATDERSAASGWVDEDHEARIFRVHRAALRSEEVFRLEMEKIFSSSWLYVGHLSELENPGDYLVRAVGGRQVIFCLDENRELRVWLNTCPHRGTTLAREGRGTARFFRCFYHAWSFSTSGALVSLPGKEAYPADDSFRDRLGLRAVPRMATRRGFVFVSFAADGPTLDEHLAGAGEHLDLVADHCAAGMEVLDGTQTYGVKGNWKLAVENAMDGYHFMPTHATFVEYLKSSGFATSDEGGVVESLGNGHSVMTLSGHSGRVGLDWEPRFGEAERARIDEVRAELASSAWVRTGPSRIADHSRIFFVFPNLLMFDIEALSIRMLEPTSARTTDVTAWHLAPRDEPDRGQVAATANPGELHRAGRSGHSRRHRGLRVDPARESNRRRATSGRVSTGTTSRGACPTNWPASSADRSTRPPSGGSGAIGTRR